MNKLPFLIKKGLYISTVKFFNFFGHENLIHDPNTGSGSGTIRIRR
jgi:hypothetical protein